MYNLRNRSFVKEIDFEPQELRHLLALSEALKTAKYAGNEAKRLEGKEIALIFEKTSTRTRSAFEVAAFDQGAHVTYLDPSGSQLGHKESVADTARVLGRMYDAIEFRGSAQDDVEELARFAGVPVYNGLTNEWHPTQMLADFLTMHEASGKPYDALTYAFVGDCRYNMGRSLLVMGALMGADVRLAGPASLRPARRRRRARRGRSPAAPARRSRSRRTSTPPCPGSTSSTPTSGCRWASRRTCGRSGCGLLADYQVNTDLMAKTGNPRAKFMHCLPAFHDPNTTVGREIMEATGMTEGIEVTGEVFESPASIVFDQAENRLHTIKAILVATLG